MNNGKILITIRYKLINEQNWTSIDLLPQDYFDLDEDVEEVDIESIPIYNHAIDYIDENKEKIEITQITVLDKANNKKIVITETFWDNLQNRLIERVDSGKAYSEEMLIIETKIRDNPDTYEIIRINRKDGILVPEYHGFITQNADGSQTEKRVHPYHGYVDGSASEY